MSEISREMRPDSPEIKVNFGESKVIATWTNTCLYYFPHDPHMNHIYFSEGNGRIVYDSDEIFEQFVAMDFPMVVQPIPPEKEIESYLRWQTRRLKAAETVADMLGDLDG